MCRPSRPLARRQTTAPTQAFCGPRAKPATTRRCAARTCPRHVLLGPARARRLLHMESRLSRASSRQRPPQKRLPPPISRRSGSMSCAAAWRVAKPPRVQDSRSNSRACSRSSPRRCFLRRRGGARTLSRASAERTFWTLKTCGVLCSSFAVAAAQSWNLCCRSLCLRQRHRLVYVGRFLPRQWPPRHTQLAVKTMSTSGAKVLGECRSKSS
mmetsp:Transcript_60800/g.169986  ORF Transcript_60800/g.169986 Transcript_60800/m.169986 type:complete len:212 (+) Transcript_60800:1464-2099(+)